MQHLASLRVKEVIVQQGPLDIFPGVQFGLLLIFRSFTANSKYGSGSGRECNGFAKKC